MKQPITHQFIIYTLIVFLMGLASTTSVFAQEKHTISGYIKDASSGETLLGAYVYEAANKTNGTSTNLYGFYSLTLPAGSYVIEASFIGFDAVQKEVTLTSDLSVNFDLPPTGILIEEIVVKSTRKDENVESTDMGRVEMSVDKIKSLPALMGEVDVIRTLQLLPGVMSSGEFNSGLYVRGGGPDQNLVLLDEAVVYNTGHLAGFFSVFNSDAIKTTTLHKGSMPAEYGGRLSSVLDVTMKDGNNKRFQAEGGIGLISSRLTLQGPIQKNRSSFLISGRRTYADVLARPFIERSQFAGSGYYFYDLNTKVNYIFSDKDRIFLSGYFGRDVFDYASPDGFTVNMPWGNATATLRWNHLFNSKLFMNATAIYNDYNFGFDAGVDDFSFKFYSGVRDYNAKLDFDYFPVLNHKVKFGINYTFHRFTPYSAEANIGEGEDAIVIEPDDLSQQYAHEAAIYIQDDFSIGKKLKVHVGLRASAYRQVGPYRYLVFGENELPTDTIDYESGEPIATYGGLEPRFSARYTINPQISLKGSVVFTNQYIHLVSNSTSTLPTDLWVPSTQRVKPQKGIQYSLGYFHNFLEDQYEASVEVYYKDQENQIEFSEDYQADLGIPVENSFVFGEGRAYGLELFLKKRTGRFNGWVGYTLSRVERSFDDINKGNTFPAKYDRTHDLSIVGIYELSKKWTLSSTFVYGTGQALTLPSSYYVINFFPYANYDLARNSYRLKPYHRLDLSATWVLRESEKYTSDLAFSIYNVYSRLNPFFVYPIPENSTTQEGAVDVKLKQVSLFPIIPSVTWNFKF